VAHTESENTLVTPPLQKWLWAFYSNVEYPIRTAYLHDLQGDTTLSELHDRRLNDVMDRIQAPEAKQIAALDAVYQPRERAAVSDPFVDVPLDEDFRLAEILETS
jgi:hypothetical protein